jgi:hypothetical protein
MKKTFIVIFGALLLCGGLFCLHLTAQTARNSFSPPADKNSLLHRKFEKCSEQELLELKVAAHRKILESVVALGEAGSPLGTYTRLLESQAGLIAAEIELYRHTGEQDKLRIALQARVDAMTEKLRSVTSTYEAASGSIRLVDVCEAELQLLDALLEQQRAK